MLQIKVVPHASVMKKSHRVLRSTGYTQKYLPPESFRSTSLAPLGANWVSKETENFKELKFFGLVLCFSVKIAQILKNRPKMAFFSCFGFNFDVFEDLFVLTEKQHTEPKNLNSLKFSASFDTQFAPSGARLVEIVLFEHFVLKIWQQRRPLEFFFVFFKIKSEASFTGLRFKNRVLLYFLSMK